jgi:hypothetical protein
MEFRLEQFLDKNVQKFRRSRKWQVGRLNQAPSHRLTVIEPFLTAGSDQGHYPGEGSGAENEPPTMRPGGRQ